MNDDIRVPKRDNSGMASPPDKDEPSFAPPQAIADQEEIIDMSARSEQQTSSTTNKASKQSLPKILKTKVLIPVNSIQSWLQKRSKKQRIIIIAAAVLLFVLVVAGTFMIFRKPKPAPKQEPAVVQEEKKVEPPKPTTEASRLTGVQVPPEYNQLPVTGIMIENSPDARPQAGLNDAGVIFEAIAEGGITRFLTLFQETQPAHVGPVRSVRPYYLQWLQGFDAAIAHVGGSGEALAKIRNEGIKDLDQSFNGSAFQRINTRYAPHNVYTSLGGLIALGKTKGYNSSTFTGFPRKVETPPPPPTIKAIDLNISGPLYNVHYDYVIATNTYNRVLAGKPHLDEKSGQQLSPKVVIAIIIPQGIHPDGVHTSYQTIGSGKAFIFQDGGMIEGTWAKGSDKEQIKFLDAAGTPIGLNPGQTWISAVGLASGVVATP